MNGGDLLMRGLQLGRVVDVIIDEDEKPIGLEVLCGDEELRFVPVVAARIGKEEVEVDSPLTMLEPEQLDFYRSRGRTLRSPD